MLQCLILEYLRDEQEGKGYNLISDVFVYQVNNGIYCGVVLLVLLLVNVTEARVIWDGKPHLRRRLHQIACKSRQ